MRDLFRKGHLTVSFLNKAANTISNYPDVYLPSHQLSINLLRNNIIPKILQFIKWEPSYTSFNKMIGFLNAWIFFGSVTSAINPGLMMYLSIGIIIIVNKELLTQQYKLYTAKVYMKRACLKYTQYMEMREESKMAIDDFLHQVDTFIDTISIDKNNKEDPPNGSTD